MKSAGESPAQDERHLWETAVRPLLVAPREVLWRAHCDAVNTALLERWLPGGSTARILKTDLFDEAMGAGLYGLLATRAASVAGLDLAQPVLAAATARCPDLLAVAADVRRLPFASESFDVVVSNSTLDHFDNREQILLALGELNRALRRGGSLLLTLDNLANPVVAVRNALPFALLRRLGLVDYPIGATCGPWRLRSILRQAGFEVQETTASLHCPRVLAVARARRLQQTDDPESRTRFLHGLMRWERLGALPTRFLTGYYIGVSARKP